MYNVFISYATKDGMALARSIAHMLREDYCLDVFLAEKEIRAGEFIESKIRSAITQCQRVLVLFTPNAVKSDWVLGEIDLAREMRKDIIVCRAYNVRKSFLPIPLRLKKHINFKNKADLLNRLRQVEWGIPVIIPAGGIAGGLHPISVGMPKSLFPVGTKPILHHIICKIETEPKIFSKVIILTTRFSGMIEYYVKILDSNIPVKSRHILGKLPITIKKLRLRTAFMVHYSDIILEGKVNWRGFLEYHKFMRRTQGVIGTLMVSRYYKLPVGRVVVDPEGTIKAFVEKPDQTLEYHVNVAVSIFEPEFLIYIKAGDARLYGACIQRAMQARKKFAIFEHRAWKHIQTLTDWYEAQKEHFPMDMS